ncbi:MAG: bifunctional folylpolyglutamate synthase/dihydrofolate synthase [Candidatus Brocadia sp. AMX2]|uniref:Dihydrofolate synthase/folylpolyglutamate synthase n=1 Tax=Candidatus Brocadia sinica JPN1 TaxID=1197129 RepID=A0ABQ0JXC5_9BACT|nr:MULTISPECIES: folylpolyglutamate synthase/dihydrofolate synthase family protein [Brocadia]KXK30281.1 MAG: folyl-polyglutamate synthase [Candidatus Brocadia sinica]MBC6933189.1 bifunctional folylpolyglutamate synthase/dihydrofolate synthase [Candidatus Brocadia sp.]MBL1169620.1 bifunctional folylpolyglutamate synthase/dihydrofolate synthase [Candidatus Brocadia sp. AMX1]KAA0243257.1 MAG: bifunctional folylpolyglutamate synthase/dihydrofolate synthase [Candidatus Brocadia sp. AMX2]MCE7867497.
MNKKNNPAFQSYEEALSFLYKAIDYEKLINYQYNASTFSLERMKKLLAYAGNPHRELPCIHITGTKGKGSTAIMISTILEHAGLTTGLFTSPHLIDIKERIQINHKKISAPEFTSILNDLRPYIQHLRETELSASPTFFEMLTAAGMLYFKKKRVEMAVLEVGLGGRLDSTNVILPQVAIITNVGLDHTAILGNTLSSIAFEKAGIIKQHVPVVSGVEAPEALPVIEKACREKDAPLYLLGRDIWVEEVRSFDRNGTRGLICKIKTWRHTYHDIVLPLVGIHQAQNCALVLGALEVMRCRNYISISDDVIREALASLYCPARIEIFSKNPSIILDFAHTVDSMRFLKKTLLENFKFHKLILILGFSQDKDLDNILKEIVWEGDCIVVTRSRNPRAAEPDDLYRRIEKLCGKRSKILDNVRDAVASAKQIASQDDLICITGSAYLAGEARQSLDLQ